MKEEKDILKQSIISDFKQETPSFDFTDKVMQKIEFAKENPTVVKPLITKKAWLMILSGFAIVLFLSFAVESIQSITFDSKWFKSLQSVNWSNYRVTIKLFTSISVILILMSFTDLFYRRWKHVH